MSQEKLASYLVERAPTDSVDENPWVRISIWRFAQYARISRSAAAQTMKRAAASGAFEFRTEDNGDGQRRWVRRGTVAA